MKSRFLLILIITITTLLFFASTSAISGFFPSKVHEVNELLEKDGVVKRTTLFNKALKSLGCIQQKEKQKLQQMDRLAETFCTLSIDTTLSTLDEIGHLAASFCCLHINTPPEGDYDDPESQITTDESPPGYDDIIRYKQAPAEVIEELIKSCYERYLILEQAEYFSLIEGDLEKALHDFPSFTGSDSWHSALLYQLQRKILIQTSNYEKARLSVEKELTALDFTFIEAYDPSIIADYACILEHLGQSGFALDMLENRVTAESRPYIRRHAALWRARHFTAAGQLERAEEAYLEAVISSNCDPQAFTEFIGFLHNQGNSALARAMVGMMNVTVLDQKNWWGKQLAGTDFNQYLQQHIPEEYRGYTGVAADLMRLGRYIAAHDYMNELSHLLGLFRLFTDKSGWFIQLQDFESTIIDLVFEIPDHPTWKKDVSSEQMLRYFKTLYRDCEIWMTGVVIGGVYSAKRYFSTRVKNYYETKGFLSLNEDIKTQCDNNLIDYARYVVERDRQKGLTAKLQAADLSALAIVLEFGIRGKQQQQAIEAFVDLCLQYACEIDSIDGDFACWLRAIVVDMSAEQVDRAIHNIIQNFSSMYYFIPELIIIFSESCGKHETASALRNALVVDNEPVPLHDSYIRTISGWLKGTPFSEPENFSPEIIEALQTHPVIDALFRSKLSVTKYCTLI